MQQVVFAQITSLYRSMIVTLLSLRTRRVHLRAVLSCISLKTRNTRTVYWPYRRHILLKMFTTYEKATCIIWCRRRTSICIFEDTGNYVICYNRRRYHSTELAWTSPHIRSVQSVVEWWQSPTIFNNNVTYKQFINFFCLLLWCTLYVFHLMQSAWLRSITYRWSIMYFSSGTWINSIGWTKFEVTILES